MERFPWSLWLLLGISLKGFASYCGGFSGGLALSLISSAAVFALSFAL